MTKDIPGYEGRYVVTDEGTILNSKGKEIYWRFDKDGYKLVLLSNSGIKKSYYIHRLVCMAFLDNPDNKPQVNHKNGIRSDNRLENLEWCTISENVSDGFKRGRKPTIIQGEQAINHKLKGRDIPAIRQMISDGHKIQEISNQFNVSYSTIYSIKSGKNWKHIP